MSAILSPFIDALLPADRQRAVRRTRNVALWLLPLVFLLPRAVELGTATNDRRNWMGLVFAVLAVGAHFLISRPRAIALCASLVAAAGVALTVLTHGAPFGLCLSAILLMFLVGSALRVKWRHRVPFRAMPVGVGIMRMVQGLAASLVSTMIFVEFAVLPIHVPTGSMRPTIYGVEPPDPQDRLLVNRTAYAVRDPRRWEIVVFQFPLQRITNFVKRVVGLPGEEVEIRDGDVWINGSIARKPPLVQESLWHQIFPKPSSRARPIDVATQFTAESRRGGAGWSRTDDGVRCRATGNDVSWFATVNSFDVADLRIGANATVAAGGAASLRLKTRGTPVVLTLHAVGGGAGTLQVGSDEAVPVAAELNSGDRVELSTAEGLVRATVNGVLVAEGEVSVLGPRDHGCALGASRAEVAFRDIVIEADVKYVSKGPGHWKVPPDSFFMLGDNSQNSEDSRLWSVTEFDVKGAPRPFRAADTLLSEQGGQLPNIERKDGAWTFIDVDGVLRTVAKADLASKRDGVPAPFVPRDHLIGRAVLIFWPVVPTSGGFRPRFLP